MKHRGIGNCAATRVLVIFALGLMFVVAAGSACAATTERVGIASNGAQANSWSEAPSISADGRFVAFCSSADNLVEGDTNAKQDVLLFDRLTGQTERTSMASDETQGDGDSTHPHISADDRFVAFESYASNLVANDTNGAPDIFVHNQQTGTTERISIASDGTEGNGGSYYPFVSAGGRFVAFHSETTNLVAGDTNNTTDIFVHDRLTGETTRVSVASDGTQANALSLYPALSADGRFVAFESDANNVVPGDTNGHRDVFVHDRDTGETTRVSFASDGTQGNGNSQYSFISSDGRFVAFDSYASNLVPGDTNSECDIFLHDRQIAETTRVSVASDELQGNGHSALSSISADGRLVAFYSDANNLVPGDTNGCRDIFVRDQQTAETTRVSVASDGTEANSHSKRRPSISADGRFVAFSSYASNLVPGDTNGEYDTFVHDRGLTLTVTTSGSGAGTVELSPPGGAYELDTTVTLTAVACPGSFFDHWEGDLSGTTNPATSLMDKDKNVVAYFTYPQLTVLSAPIVDVAITGTRAGTTPYSADCDLHEAVTLTAPESVAVGGRSYYFELWFVDNVSVPPDVDRPFNEVEVTMDDRRTAVAQYDWRLPGDYNDDCVVNVLDLLYVRNRLGTTCSE